MESSFEFLRLIQSRDLSFWDVKRLSFSFSSLSKIYSSVKLGDILTPIKNKIKKDEYNGQFPIISKISFNDGKIHLRDDFKTGMDLYSLSLNDLLISNINFHQGATAINKIGNIVCSTHYQPYRIDFYKVTPEYLILVLRNKIFLEYVSRQKVNGIKTESNYNFIKDLEIPLPSLKRQKELVAQYDALLNLVKNKENQAKQIEQSIDDYLLQNLNLTQVVLNNENESTLLKFINFSQTKYWHYNYFFSPYKNIYDIENIGINFVPLSSLVLSISSGKDERDYKNEGYEYLRVSNIRPGKLLLNDVKYISALPKCQHGVVKNGDFIITRKGSYGYAVYLDFIKQNYAISSEIFKVILKDNEKLNKKYLEYIFNSPVIQTQIENIKTRGIMGSINIPALKSIEIPLLPLDIQARIVEEITLRKEQIKNLRNESEKLRSQALSDFEKEVFN